MKAETQTQKIPSIIQVRGMVKNGDGERIEIKFKCPAYFDYQGHVRALARIMNGRVIKPGRIEGKKHER